MSTWTRPDDFEDMIADQWDDMPTNEIDSQREAFLAGALYAALIAEGRL